MFSVYAVLPVKLISASIFTKIVVIFVKRMRKIVSVSFDPRITFHESVFKLIHKRNIGESSKCTRVKLFKKKNIFIKYDKNPKNFILYDTRKICYSN